MQTYGRKEVGEAVLVAALCSLACGLIEWAIDCARAKFNPHEEEEKK